MCVLFITETAIYFIRINIQLCYYISNNHLSETEKKNHVGIFINGPNTLSLEENIKHFFSAAQKFILKSGRLTHDANNYTCIHLHRKLTLL